MKKVHSLPAVCYSRPRRLLHPSDSSAQGPTILPLHCSLRFGVSRSRRLDRKLELWWKARAVGAALATLLHVGGAASCIWGSLVGGVVLRSRFTGVSNTRPLREGCIFWSNCFLRMVARGLPPPVSAVALSAVDRLGCTSAQHLRAARLT